MDLKVDELFKYFEEGKFENRSVVRDNIDIILKSFPDMNQQIVEGLFSKYKQSQLPSSDEIKIVTISDLHVPFHNMDFVELFIEFLKDFQPDKIVLNGDIVDFYDLSHFDKNPKRVGVLQKELDIVNGILMLIRLACPLSEIIYIEGNHEDRLRKFLWKNPSISSLRDLKLERLLRFPDVGNIRLVEEYDVRGMKFTHGGLVRKHSSYSAKAEYDHHLQSGASGHTHRLGVYNKTTDGRVDEWIELGCGCLLRPEYIKGCPDWQNGFLITYIIGNKIFNQLVKSIDNSFVAIGKLYK